MCATGSDPVGANTPLGQRLGMGLLKTPAGQLHSCFLTELPQGVFAIMASCSQGSIGSHRNEPAVLSGGSDSVCGYCASGQKSHAQPLPRLSF